MTADSDRWMRRWAEAELPDAALAVPDMFRKTWLRTAYGGIWLHTVIPPDQV